MLKIKEVIGGVKLPARASAWYLAASAVGKAAGVLVTPLFTRLLDRDEYGRFTLYMTLLGVATVICSAASSGSAVYKGLKDYSKFQEGYLKGVLAVTLCFSALICILLFAFSSLLSLRPILLIPLSLQIFCDGITSVAITRARFYYKYKSVSLISIINAILPPILSVSMLYLFGGDYMIRIYALLFVSLITAVVSLLSLTRGKDQPDRRTVKYIVRSSLPLLPHTISSALSGQTDKFIITAIMGTAALAKYSVVYSMGIGMQFIVNAIGSALSPWIIRRLAVGEEKRVTELIMPMTLGYCALSLCLIAISPEALLILAPKDYLDALAAIVPIALSIPFYFISSVVAVGLIQQSIGKYSVLLSCVSAVLSVTLNYMLIARYGYFGAGVATLAHQALSAILGIFLLNKASTKSVIPPFSFLLPCVASLGVGSLIYLLKDIPWARCLIMLIPIGALVYCMSVAKSLVIEKPDKACA